VAKAKSRSKAKKSKPKAKSKKMKAKAKPKKAKAKAKAKPKKAKAKAKPKAKKAKAKRKPNPAFMKPLTPDAALAAIVGSNPLPRTEITKKLWAYIKKNGLQDSVNRRNINADEALKKVFNGRSSVTMFEMTKLVASHLS
jgi:chromatin remodeling complex protein RSC6